MPSLWRKELCDRVVYVGDRAMLNYSWARLAILKQQVQLTAADVKKMRELRDKLAQTSSFNQVFDLALNFVGFLRDRIVPFS